MLVCLVEREIKGKGGKQMNRVNLPVELSLHGWESTRLLYEAGQLPKSITLQYKYISEYEEADWEEEEAVLGVGDTGQYLLNGGGLE